MPAVNNISLVTPQRAVGSLCDELSFCAKDSITRTNYMHSMRVLNHEKNIHLNFLQLLLIGAIHLLKAFLQFPITIQESLAQLSCQMKIYASYRQKEKIFNT